MTKHIKMKYKSDIEEKMNFYRSPDKVMKLTRIGAFHQTRLSFMRQLLRRIFSEKWSFLYHDWSLDRNGFGHVVFSVETPSRVYSLVAFSHDLPPNKRSDRVIATEWDLTFALVKGVPSPKEIKRLAKEVPFQEAGRLSENELVLGRANRSVRLWNSVVDKLSSGNQPSMDEVKDVGYLMRTTAVYGSGKFGLADRSTIDGYEEFFAPFQVELLAVFLLRNVVFDLVDYFAKIKGGSRAVTLSNELKKVIGIGNSTGLGMAPFLVHHPELLNKWISARECAVTRVLELESISQGEFDLFKELLSRSLDNVRNWKSVSPSQIKRIDVLGSELTELIKFSAEFDFKILKPWLTLFSWVEKKFSLETQELFASLILEPYGKLIDELGLEMSFQSGNMPVINGRRTCAEIILEIEDNFSWAIEVDYEDKDQSARFWYYSQTKLEPRLGERYEEEGSNLEEPLAVGRDIKYFYCQLLKVREDRLLADYLMEYPEHRLAAKRVLASNIMPYGEIRDNLISKSMKPLDMLRCKLSFFGATKFDPRSDRWVRICMYQNAPLAGSDCSLYDDFWPYPDKS